MQIGYSDDKGKRKLDKKLFGCPACHASRYVVVTSLLKTNDIIIVNYIAIHVIFHFRLLMQ